MQHSLKDVLLQFNIDTDISEYGEGHINDTYYADFEPDKYILQRINHNVFKDPYKLMENVASVTEFLQKKIKKEGGDPERETLMVIKTRDKSSLYKTPSGEYFRMYRFIDNAVTYQNVENKHQFYSAGKAFGKFQNRLSDFPADSLYEVIKDFHNTKKRFNDFLDSVKNDKAGRVDSAREEIEFVLKREKDTAIVVEEIEKGLIPLRVTHNDTKLNNVLFDSLTDDAMCVIDLDTVMPGSLLYDFGDAIRFGASSGAEDEPDLSKIWCDLELFEAFTKGFLEDVGKSITKREAELLAFSAKLISLECGMRFLTDYLDGDTYFKISRPDHNLIRCRTQFKLVSDMEEKMDEMNEIVKKYL